MKALLLLALALVQATASPRLDAALARMDEYLLAYEPKLSELIAEETLVQEITLPRNQLYMPREAVTPGPSLVRRRITSEVAFIALPGDAGWLGFRHVKTVNQRAVEDEHASLGTALQGGRYEAARALLSAGAQHNLGLPRTTNLPNLPLEFLHPRNRKRFLTRLDAGSDTIAGVKTLHIVFLERITPTLIRNPDTNADMPSVVHAWINEKNGQLLRAEVNTFVSFAAKHFENSLRVEFAEEKALGLLVPSRMREVFPVESPRTGTGAANYSNFRKFQTSARIVPQEF